jgi:hypothetical protein
MDSMVGWLNNTVFGALPEDGNPSKEIHITDYHPPPSTNSPLVILLPFLLRLMVLQDSTRASIWADTT